MRCTSTADLCCPQRLTMVDPQSTARAEYAQRIQPLLESLATACIREMPSDPVSFMHSFLTEDVGDAARPSMAATPGEQGDKAKGRGKAAGPAGPANSAKGKGKTKGKHEPFKAGAKGGFAGNMKKLTKPTYSAAFYMLKAQQADGSVDADALGQQITEVYNSHFLHSPGIDDPKIDFAARLKDIHPTAATMLLLRCMDKADKTLWEGSGHVDATVQGVGDGRGVAGEREAFSTGKTGFDDRSEEQRREHRKLNLRNFCTDSQPLCGVDFDKMGEAWLAAQTPPASVEPAVLELIQEWFCAPTVSGMGNVKKVSEEDLKAKAEMAKRKSLAWQDKEQEFARRWRSLRPRPVDAVPWAEVEQTKWCSAGMSEATLMQVGGQECVVLKTFGLYAVAEVLAEEVATLFGVRVAASRVLAADALRDANGVAETMAPEFREMLDAIGRAPMEDQTSVTASVTKSRFGQADFVAVTEFVPGTLLQGLEGMQTLQGESAPSVLQQLGSLLALHCVLNNVDKLLRFSSIADRILSNIMVTADGVVGVGQRVNAIGDPSGRARHLKSLADFCAEAARGSTTGATTKRVALAIHDNCGVELDEASLQAILKGAEIIFQRIKVDKDGLTSAIKALDNKMRNIFGRAKKDVGLAQIETMTGFLVQCVETVSSAA